MMNGLQIKEREREREREREFMMFCDIMCKLSYVLCRRMIRGQYVYRIY